MKYAGSRGNRGSELGQTTAIEYAGAGEQKFTVVEYVVQLGEFSGFDTIQKYR